MVRIEGILDGFPLSPRENPRYFPGCLGCILTFLNQTRVLLADNDHGVLEAEIALLSRCLTLGAAADGAALVSKARNLLPDVLVTGISMPISTEVVV